ncbi:MAG: ABC transporter ATP-binding protein [Desulfobacteraceae bacterium]|nr:ABC transporter ATP-binding protein [Desulfobacteraceae bacterium]MBC2757861.1 ABC transporter ATP-binding protein [Desulfobacteraceae bacterium]
MTLFSFVELAIVTLIVPFISALQNNLEMIPKYEFAGLLMDKNDPKAVVLYLAFVLLFLFSFKAVSDWFIHYDLCRLTQKIKNDLILNLYNGYLNLEYVDYKRFNTNTFIKNCLITTQNVVFSIHKTSETIRDSLLALVLVLALLNQSFQLSFFFISALALMGILFFKLMKGRQYNAGKTLEDSNRKLQKWVSQSFLSVKEIKINDSLAYYKHHLEKSLNEYNHANITLAVFPRVPKIILEYLVFTGLIAGALLVSISEQSVAGLVPVIVFYAFVIRRLIPLVNNIVSSHLELTGALASIQVLKNEFNIIQDYHQAQNKASHSFESDLSICGLNFSYNENAKVLDNINLHINKGDHIAVVGKTGSGKSTLVELICGLLEPEFGYFIADGKKIQNTRGLQHMIGYVPQQVYLLDESILSNITLREPDTLTGEERKWVQELAEICQINEFTDQLEKRLDTRVGERGNNLSGGQIQRVGIARQLFKKPGLLILDEATAAVDDKVETKVLEAIKQGLPDLTIIMVTHRISSLKKVDQVILIDKGKVAWKGDSGVIPENALKSIDSDRGAVILSKQD